jgi:PKD repeat protein
MYRSLRRDAWLLAALAAALGPTGCTLGSQEAPPLTGPSGFALGISLRAEPDVLPRDGVSQSQVTVTVYDASGAPKPGQRLALSVAPSTAALSTNEVSTNASGIAAFTVTAPPPDALGNAISVSATPIGDDFVNARSQSVTIALSGTPNATVPTPSFTVTPASPEVRQLVTFDASATKDEGSACLDACSYSWNMDDGTTKSGRIVTHSFAAARPYNVTLTVTDAAGMTASVQQRVTVVAVLAPTVTLTVNPDPPLAGQQATFTANATAAAGHSITEYRWDFGDGTTQTTTSRTVTKTYNNQGTYVVSVTVTDDLGQTGAVAKALNITSSAISATISFSPTNPVTNQRIHFAALNATAPNGATITKYEWNFGDSEVAGGGTAEGQTVEHKYTQKGTYVVRLTITASNGLVGVVTTQVTVSTP